MNEQWLISIANPVLRDHTVHGQHLMPGLAYVDLLYQLFRKHRQDFSSLELRNVSIYHPLAVARDYDVMLDIRATQQPNGHWQIVVDGMQRRDDRAVGESQRYVTAEMWPAKPALFNETLDLQLIKKSASRQIDLEDLYMRCRQRGLVHVEFMKPQGTLYLTNSTIYVDCCLSEAAKSSANSMLFHPALIDGSAVCGAEALTLLSDGGKPELILPLFYESFRASDQLQSRCIARIPLASVQHKHELRYFTVEFFDEAGKQVAELKNYAGKLVRDADSIKPGRTNVSSSTQYAAEAQDSSTTA